MTSEEVLAMQKLTEAVEQHTEELRLQNAILAVQTMNEEKRYRQQANHEEPTSYSYTDKRFAGDLDGAIHTFEEELER
jgi:hypothetical protein